MDLETILSSSEFKLPAKNNTGRPFIAYVEQIIDKYIHDVKNSTTDLFSELSVLLGDFDEFVDVVERLGKGLIKTIRLNNAGKADDAYAEFESLMQHTGVFIRNHPGAVFFVNPNDIFYRCKYPNAPSLKPQQYFFHAPFELSNKVRSTRFSFNGFPSIYLANAMIVGYFETRAQGLDNFQGVKIQAKYPLSFLDIDYNKPYPAIKATDKATYDTHLQIKGMIYPLLFCCYCQQNDDAASAPAEYVVPQFLMRWVRKFNNFYTGIKYSSTRIDGPNFIGEFYNLIIPPIEVLDEGYCPELKRQFKMSEVCGWLVHKKEIENYFSTTFDMGTNVNDKVQAVEWDAKCELYEHCPVGRMEYYMKNKLASGKIRF